MGIKNLTKFIKEYCPADSIRTVSFQEYKGKKLAIDADLYMYQALYAASVDGSNIDTYGDENHFPSFLNSILYKIISLKQFDIKLIFVFDGENKSHKLRNDLEKQDVLKITNMDKYLLQRMLSIIGIPFKITNDEAEKYCCSLVLSGIVDGVITQDSDCLIFGCSYLKDINIREKTFSLVDHSMISRTLGLDKEKWKCLALCLGCDYIEKIKGMGPKNIKKKLDENNFSLEKILKNEKEFKEYSSKSRIFDRDDDIEDILDDQLEWFHQVKHEEKDRLESFLKQNGCPLFKIPFFIKNI